MSEAATDDSENAGSAIDLDTATWADVGSAAEVKRARRVVVEGVDGEAVLVLAHEGDFYAFANICIHKQRELAKGVILNDRLVCPGHQWAFDLQCGWEAVKNRCQPTFTVRVNDDERVEVDLASRAVLVDGPATS